MTVNRSSNLVSRLKDLDLSNRPVLEIKSILKSSEICIRQAKLRDDVIICRLRDGVGYRAFSDFMPPIAEKCAKVQRYTLPNTTAFYSSIADNQNRLEDALYISLNECSSLINGGIESCGKELYTASFWKIKQPLKVASFVIDKTYPEVTNNEILNGLRNEYKKNKSIYTQDLIEFGEFINEEFCKPVSDDYDYLITASISDVIFNEFGYDGILYPSVKTRGNAGVNLALAPDVARTNLSMYGIIELEYHKCGKYSSLNIINVLDSEEIVFNE